MAWAVGWRVEGLGRGVIVRSFRSESWWWVLVLGGGGWVGDGDGMVLLFFWRFFWGCLVCLGFVVFDSF